MKDPAPAASIPIIPISGELSSAFSKTLIAPSQPEGGATLPKGAVLGRYVILDCLGEGGMGVVYAAYDPELDRKIALKLLLGQEREGPLFTEGRTRLLREAQAMARLSHPNVIAVHDVGTFDGQVFIAMEFVEGPTLTDWLSERERTISEIIAMFTQAGRGLAAAHAGGIVHRDFKPDNVLIGKDGRARVLDFGLAHAEQAEAAAPEPAEGEARSLGGAAQEEPARLPGLHAAVAARTHAGAGGEPAPPPASGPVSSAPSPPVSSAPSGPVSSVPSGPVSSAPGVPVSSPSSVLSVQLTKTGAFMGTPMYMSPEQFTRAPTDARTDQFSFCIALAEALYGEPPFAGDTVMQRSRHVTKGEVRDEPRGKKLPSGLRKALLRGLSVKKEDRFATMDELLEAIQVRPPRSPRQWLSAAATVLVPIAVIGALLLWRDQPARMCAGAEQKLAGVWDAGRKQAIQNAFLASGKPYAKDAFAGVERAVDAYAHQWVAMHSDACLATRARGEQSEELLDLRMECLSQRLAELRALADLLSAADAGVLEQSVQSAQSLTVLDGCANAAALKAPVRPPPDAETRTKVQDLRGRLARIRALEHAGRYGEQRAMAEPVAAEAQGLKYRPIEAEALFALGKAHGKIGNLAEAEKTLISAVIAAEAGRHDELCASIWIELAGLQTAREAEALERARPSTRHAAAVIERLGGHAELSARLETALGLLAWYDIRYDDAAQHHGRALEALQKLLGQEHLEVASALHNLAKVAYSQGKFADAITYDERALAIQEKAVGRDHPLVAATLSWMGGTLESQGKLEEALQLEQRAVAIDEKALGPEHTQTGIALGNLANTLGSAGRIDEAIGLYERVLAILEKTHGQGHIRTSTTLNNIGATLVDAGRHEEALPYLERSIAVQEKTKGTSYSELSLPLNNMGSALLHLERYKEALARFDRAFQVAKNALGDEHPYVADALVGLGKAHLKLRDPAKALPLLEQALALRIKLEENPAFVAEARFVLASALWDAGKDRKRAGELAESARKAFAAAGDGSEKELAEVDAWLRAHRP